MADDNKPDLTLVVDNDVDDAEDDAEDDSAADGDLYRAASLQGHRFTGRSLLDAVDILDKGSKEALPVNDLKDVGLKLSVLGMAEAHIRRLNRLDRAMNLIEQQLATPDRLAQLPSNELTKLYRLLGASMEVSQRYVKESIWSVNTTELQEQITDLVSGGGGKGEESDHSTREVVADIFRRVSTLGQNFPEPSDTFVPEVNPDHLPNDLLSEEKRAEAEQHRQDSHNAVLEEARAEHRKALGDQATKQVKAAGDSPAQRDDALSAALSAHGTAAAGLSQGEWQDVMADEVGASAPLDLTGDEELAPASAPAPAGASGDWLDDALDGKDDPLSGFDVKF